MISIDFFLQAYYYVTKYSRLICHLSMLLYQIKYSSNSYKQQYSIVYMCMCSVRFLGEGKLEYNH